MNSIESQSQYIRGGVQPRHHVPKHRRFSDVRRRKIIAAYLTGKPLEQAAIEAGYAPKTAGRQASMILQEPGVMAIVGRILQQAGITDEFLAERLHALTEAEETIFAQYEGRFVDERKKPSHETRRKTIELICRLKGHLDDGIESDTHVNVMQSVIAAMNSASGGECERI